MIMRMPVKLAEIVNDAPILVLGIDNDGVIEYANPCACQTTGLPPEDISQRYYWELMPEAMARRAERFFRRLKADSIPTQYEGPLKTARGADPIIEWRT